MWPISIKHLVITRLVNYRGFIQWSQKKELSFSCATRNPNPAWETPSGHDTPIVTAGKTTQAPFMWNKSRSSSVQAVPISASVLRGKRWPFCPGQQHSHMLWFSHLDWVDLAGQAKVFIGEKLTQLDRAAKRLFDLWSSGSGIESMPAWEVECKK